MSPVTGPDPSISLQRRDGVWEKLGTGVGGYGIVPESITWVHSVSQGGPTSLTFLLHQDPRRKRNDLEQFTPVSVKMGSGDEWSGRIISLSTARGDDQTINVECEGWYQHTKDWSYDKYYVQRNLNKWFDARSLPAAPVAKFPASSPIETGDRQAVISFTNGEIVPATSAKGITLDLGPNNTAKRIVMTWTSTNNSAAVTCFLRASDDGACGFASANYNDATSFAMNSGTGTTSSGTFTTPYRYVTVFLYHAAGATMAAAVTLTITDIQVFAATAYESSNASILKASDVVADVLTTRCPLISTDQSLITATTFAIPSYAPDPGQFPNQMIDAVNSYHGWNFYMTPEPTPRAVYEALPTVPSYALGAGDSYKFTSPAERNGRETYSQVTMSYQDATGVPKWTTASTPTVGYGANLYAISTSPTITNPSFDTNTTGWACTGSSRITAANGYKSSPASLGNTAAGGTGSATQTLAGLTAGRNYRIQWAEGSTNSNGTDYTQLLVADSTSGKSLGTPSAPAMLLGLIGWSGTYRTMDFTAESSSVLLTASMGSGVAIAWMDDFTLMEQRGSIVTQRGFTRELVVSPSGPLTSAAATQIAQTILDARQLPPLKGTLEAPEGVREALTGRRVPPWSIRSGKAIILEDEQDPNTGAFGRVGVIQTVTYNHDTRTATLEVDSATDFVDQLLNRIGAR